MTHILVIDEGHAGHLTQSRGLATELAARLDATLEMFAVHLSLSGLLRPLLRLATDLSPHGLPDWALRLAFRWTGELSSLRADVIVTSSGHGLYFATSLARRLGCPLVFCGDPSPLPVRWCDVILSPVPVPGHARVIQTELLVTEMSPERISGRGEAYRDASVRAGGTSLATLLVGGDSRSHRYTRADWERLARGINQLGERGWRWLVSTSRRTPEPAEHLLRESIEPRFLVKAVWWHAQPERVMLDYLGAADVVLVTQDSLSMLSEAMAAGKPVVSLVPSEVRPSKFIESVLSLQEERRRLVRVPIDALGDWDLRFVPFRVVDTDLVADYASQVAAILPPVRGSRHAS